MKKLAGLLFCLILSLFFLPGQGAEAADTTASGSCGDNVSYVLDSDGVLTISGTGDMKNYSRSSGQPWTRYITKVIINPGVTSIGDYAFYDCSSLADVTIPASVTSIGNYAFYFCSSLTDVTIPASVTSIGDRAFYYCSSLNHLYLTDLGAWCRVTIGYGGSPFSSSSGDHTVFLNGAPLTKVEVPSGVTEIGTYAFSKWNQITDVTLPEGVTSIGDYAFNNCSSLTSVMIPEDVTSIGYAAFNQCSSLTGVTIPEGVDSIKTDAFRGCSSLASVTILEGVTSIGGYAFYGCSSLTDVTIPASVTSIGDYAFYNCSSVSHLYLTDLSAWCQIPFGSESHLSFGSSGDHMVFLNGTPLTKLVIPSGVTAISDYAFCGWKQITDVTIPEGVTSIGGFAFSGCSSLTSVTIPEGVTSIGDGAFSDCSALTSLTIPEGGDSIGNFAFYYCSKLTEVIIREGVTSIGERAFSDCSALTSVTIPASVTSIGTDAFYQCFSVRDLYLSDLAAWCRISFADRTNHPFYGFYGGHRVFLNGTLLTELTIPSDVTAIGAYTFREWNQLTAVTIPSSVTSIDQYAFYHCSSVTDLTIREGVTSIGLYAFAYCTSLTSVTIPASVDSIDQFAFSNNPSLVWAEFCGNAPSSFDSLTFEQCAPGFCIGFHDGKTGWTTPFWYRYRTACVDKAISDYSALDDNDRNAQGLLFALNDTASTAVLGNGSSSNNNAGFYGEGGTTVYIPETVTKNGKTYQVVGIGQYALAGSPAKKVVIGKNVSSVMSTAFLNCCGLTEFEVQEGSRYFCAEDGILYDVVKAWLYCFPCGKRTAEFRAPDSVRTIGEYSFSGCRIDSLIFPDTVTAIMEGALKDSVLDSVVLPFIGRSASDSRIFYSVFGNATANVRAVTITGEGLRGSDFYTSAGKYGSSIQCITLTVPVTSIPNDTFRDLAGLKALRFTVSGEVPEEGELRVPGSVSTVGNYAFAGCTSFTSLTVCPGVESIGSYAFSGCSGLKTMTLGEGVKTINQYAFSSCSQLETVTVEDGVGPIGQYAFNSCKGLETVVMGDRLGSIENYAFKDCSRLKTFSLGDGAKSIGQNAFSGCTALETVVVGTGLGNIGSNAFKGCARLKTFSLGENAGSIDSYAFSGCSGLEAMTLGEGLKSLGVQAFASCGSLKEVDLPASLTYIGSGCFDYCTGVERFTAAEGNPVYLSDKWGVLYSKDKSTLYYYPSARKWPFYNVADETRYISGSTFYKCNNLINLYLPTTVTSISTNAISSCNNLTVCMYMDSYADRYVSSKTLTGWYMDNYAVQGIDIYALPEQTDFEIGQVDFEGLYLAADWGGRLLQLDDYTILYEDKPGPQTVTVQSGNFSASFTINLFEKMKTVDFGEVDLTGKTAYAAVYQGRKMIAAALPTMENSHAVIHMEDPGAGEAVTAKLFLLDSVTKKPLGGAIEGSIQNP